MNESITLKPVEIQKKLTPSFVNEESYRDREPRWDNTPSRRIKTALNRVNTELNSKPEYFPERNSKENLDIIKNNLTTHVLFHIMTQNSIGNLQNMENLVTHDLHFVNLIGGFEDVQKRKLSIAAGIKLNSLSKELIQSPNSRAEDFGPNIIGDFLIFSNILDSTISAEQKNAIKLAIGENNTNNRGQSFVDRAIERLKLYDNDRVMKQFADAFSPQDQELIKQNRGKILETQKQAVKNSINYLESIKF
jgi:hypothetical protein